MLSMNATVNCRSTIRYVLCSLQTLLADAEQYADPAWNAKFYDDIASHVHFLKFAYLDQYLLTHRDRLSGMHPRRSEDRSPPVSMFLMGRKTLSLSSAQMVCIFRSVTFSSFSVKVSG